MNNNIEKISIKLSITKKQVENTLELLNEGATVPFISRYRKEKTGSLDEVQILAIKEENEKLIEIDKRRNSIIELIDKQNKLTDSLRLSIEKAESLNELEDIYLPYKQKRKTKATIAKDKGLEPLAKIVYTQRERNVFSKASSFINKLVNDEEDALQGARYIIAEWINENQVARSIVRNQFNKIAKIKSKVVKIKKDEATKYSDYFDFEELLKKCPSHRLLAIKRGEAEGFLKVSISPDNDYTIENLNRFFVKNNNESSNEVSTAISDSYNRLLKPSIETEFKNLSKEKADFEAINVFTENLKQLLLAAPLGEKKILAIDPGFRTGCKLVCLDNQGSLLYNDAIFPHPPQNDKFKAQKKIEYLLEAYKIEAIAIGNGTASRETEFFIKKALKYNKGVKLFIVNESGASIYSASKTARDEFPDYDVTVRGAVSIGRRLMDPLAELVKIDPKSIGVGQYQHDVDQKKLQNSLQNVVESSVNLVGVDLNTASKHLLSYVSGLGPQLAQNIIDYRVENGLFESRKQLKKVKRLGNKAFEQCAGFLRIRNAKNPLDSSAVHPESYHIVNNIAKDLNITVKKLIENDEVRKKIEIEKYISDKVGVPTLKDIIVELSKPGRDPRDKPRVSQFSENIKSINDLKEGMIISGVTNNITNFGVFVDIGIKENGLIHISNLKNEFVSNPHEVVKLNQVLKTKIIGIDKERKRIQLSLKDV